MAIRTTATDVRAIAKDLDETYFEADDDFDPFIMIGNQLVDWVAAQQVVGSRDLYSDAVYKSIETWLTAHFCRILDPQRSSEQVADVQESYQQKVDLGLDQTRYGQTAKLLDTQGWLAGLDNAQKEVKVPLEAKRKAGLKWVGSRCP